MKLSDAKLRTLTQPGKHFDGAGLYLELTPAGGRYWRLKYRHAGKEKRLALGVYPAVSLKAARQRATEARERLAAGIDPSAQRQADKASQARAREAEALAAAGEPLPGTFEHVAREWYGIKRAEWSDSYGSKLMRRLEVDVFPWIGALPLDSIAPPKILEVLRRIEARGVLETAHRARDSIGQVFLRLPLKTGVLNLC